MLAPPREDSPPRSSLAPAPHPLRWGLRALLFVGIFWGLAAGLNALLVRGFRKQEGGAYGTWNRIAQGRAGADLGIFGSSGALVDFDCEVIGARTGMRCQNYGVAAGFNDFLPPLTKVLLAHNQAPRVAIVQFSIMSFMNNPQPTDAAQFLPYDDAPMLDYLVSLDRRFLYWRHVPLYGVAMDGVPNLRFAIAGLRGRVVDPRPLGRMMVDSTWDGTFEEFVKNAPNGTTYPIEPSSVAGSYETIALLREKGARVVLVETPEWEAVQPYELDREQIDRTIREIAERTGAPLIDYSHHPISSKKELFYNPRHLNARGVAAFSQVLADDLGRVLAKANAE